MPNLRTKTWTTTTPANVEDAQYWEDHLISDAVATKAANSVQSVNSTTPDANGNVDIVALPAGGTTGQVLTKQSNTSGDADWEDPASSGHTIEDATGTTMAQQPTLQFTNAEVTNDSVNSKTIVDCKGTKGDPGDAATVTVGTVTTLPAGSSATVTNSGTTSAAVFNFGIPKGADGTGAGDMLKADYDSDSAVELAGGIASYVASQAYTLPTAASNVLGGVKVGTNLSIDASGVLSATDTKALSSMTDVTITSASNGQALLYDSASSKWVNGNAPSGGILPHLYITTEADAMVFVRSNDHTDIYPTEVSSGHYECDLPDYGIYTIHSDIEGDDATYTFSVDAVKEYHITVMHYTHTINVTVMSGASISISGGGETISGTGTGSSEAFTVHNASTVYTVTTSVDGASAPAQTVTTPAQSEQSTSLTFQYGTINLTFANEFRGLTLTCSSGGTTISKVAPSTGNTMAFYPPSTGTWEIVGIYSGVPYSSGSIVVSSLSTPVSAILQTNVTLTVTLYGAVEDTVSFTDASGASKTETFATGQSSKSVTFKVLPSGSSITFTSSVAKNPSNLSADYSKTVTVTSGTTSVYVMPDGAIYWYGYNPYNSYIQTYATMTSVEYNGGGYTGLAPTVNRNTRDLEFTLAGGAKGGAWIFNTSLPFSSYTNLKIYTKALTVGGSSYVTPMTVANQPSVGYSPTQLSATPAIASNTVSTVPTSTLSNYIGAHHHTFNNANISFNAIWLE